MREILGADEVDHLVRDNYHGTLPAKARRAINDAVQEEAVPTTGRPQTNLKPGRRVYDTTLGKPIWWHASGVWKDAMGNTV